MAALIDLTGKTFGRLTVLKKGKTESNKVYWICVCRCGNEREIYGAQLRRRTKSCGCISTEIRVARNTTHGKSGTNTYKIWKDIFKRCNNPNNAGFKYYGARGIKVCQRWRNFENFLADMGERPSTGHSIDRIDVNGDYESSNCKWATKLEQMNNRRDNVHIETPAGRMTIPNASRKFGIKPGTLHYRVRNGCHPDKMFEPIP